MTLALTIAAQYRRQAELCRAVAERMSARSDRVRMEARARRWLELAAEAEREVCRPHVMVPGAGAAGRELR